MNIAVKAHPFQEKLDWLYFSEWRSVGALVNELGPDKSSYKLFLNDELVTVDQYDRILRNDDRVLVCGVPGEPVTLTAILTSLAISVVLSGITIAVTYLLRPKQPSLSGRDAEKNAISGIGNQTAAYEAIPKVVGRIRPFPVFPGKFPTQFTEIAGDDQYLRGYVLIGKGPVTISSIRIGETSIDDFDEVDYQVFEGKDTDPTPIYYTRSVFEETLTVELTQAASWQQRTTQLNTRLISLDWSMLRGLHTLQKDGDRKGTFVDIQIEARETGTSTWFRRTDIIQQLPSARVIYVKSSDINDARSITVHGTNSLGEAIQEVIPLGGNNSPSTGTTWTIGSTSFTTITNALLSSEDLTKTVEVGYWDGSAFVRVAYAEIYRTHANTTAALRRNTQWYVTPGQYDIRLRRVTAPSAGNTISDTTWTALRSWSDETPFNEPECAGIEFRIKASGQLNGIIQNLNCLVEAEFPVYDGANWGAAEITRNPAWACAAVLTGNANKRPVPLSQLDADSFKEFADWCDAKGFECNHVFSADSNVLDVCNLICATGRAQLTRPDGVYTIVIDRQQTEIMNHFTPRNTWDFEGTATFPEEVHAKRVGFLNEDIDYAEDEVVVYHDGYSADNATKFNFVEAQGVTNADQIWKLFRYEIADDLLQFERFSFTADFESKRCTVGDLVLVSHDVMLVGVGWGLTTKHEYYPEGGKAITIDSKVILDPAKTYGVQIRVTQTGKTIQSQIINTGFETNYFVFTAPLPGLTDPAGCLVTVGEWGEISQRCIVKSIQNLQENGYLAARITCAVEAPGRYTADEEEIPPHTPIITLSAHPMNLRPPAPFIRAIRSDETVSRVQDDGSFAANMTVSVGFPSGFNPQLVEIQAQYRPWLDPTVSSGNPWKTTPMEPGENGEIVINDVDVIVIYEVRVRSLNKLNNSLISPWTASQTHTILGDTVDPGPPTNVTGQAMDRTVSIKWTNPQDELGNTEVDFAAVEVYRSTADDISASPSNAAYVGETSGEVFIDEKLSNGTTYYYWVRARDWAGNLSDWHSALDSPAYAGLALTPTPNTVVAKAEAQLASKAMSATETILTLNYTSLGGKIRVTGRAYIDMPTNNPSDSQTTQFALRGVGDHLDTYDIALAKVGPGYPGVITFHYEDEPGAGSVNYNLLWAGSSATVNASKIAIFVEEVAT